MRPSSRPRARDASETSLFLRLLGVFPGIAGCAAAIAVPVADVENGWSSSSESRAGKSAEARVVLVREAELPLSMLPAVDERGPKSAVESKDEEMETGCGGEGGTRRVSGYSSSKRSIMPLRVLSRKDRRPKGERDD